MPLVSNSFGLIFLLSLLPGIVTHFIVDGFTIRKKLDILQRFLEIFFFSIISVTIYYIGFLLNIFQIDLIKIFSIDFKIDNYIMILIWSIAISFILGFAVTLINNYKLIFRFAYLIKLTKKTGFEEVWSDVFDKHRKRWLRVWMKDGSKIIGWPEGYSDIEGRELFLRDVAIYKDSKKYEIDNLYLESMADISYFEIVNGGDEKTND